MRRSAEATGCARGTPTSTALATGRRVSRCTEGDGSHKTPRPEAAGRVFSWLRGSPRSQPSDQPSHDLLARVKELGDASRFDLMRSCGYVSVKKDGCERLNFMVFYEALLVA